MNAPPATAPGQRMLVINADDFGASAGINHGIVEAHVRGVVTSTSLMVAGRAAAGAAALARLHRDLAVGLHWDLDSGARGTETNLDDAQALREELERQLQTFEQLVGRPPTHLDSHHHVHDEPEVAPVARELAARVGVPLRGDGHVTYIGGFYGQWEWGVTDLHHVSPDFLIWILRHEVAEGWTEIGCHPGYIDDGFTSAYAHEREAELATLTDPRVREEIQRLGIELVSYAELP